jgi:hypothetical protein
VQFLIQLLLIAVIIGVTATMGRITGNARSIAFRRILLVLFVLLAVAAVIAPDLTTKFANAIGIGRGADLLLYMLTVAFIASLAMQSRRAIELSRRNTLLVREIAIDRAMKEYPASGTVAKTLPVEPQ